MRFRNYCLVVMGETSFVKDEIVKICENEPNCLSAGGIFIATFTSFAEPVELTAWFTENNRNFLLFDLNKENSGFNIVKKEIHNGLFGFLETINTEEMNENFLNSVELSADTKNIINLSINRPIKEITVGLTVSKNKLSEEYIANMSSNERQDLLNELIEFGLDKLSESDQKLLPLLTK